MVFKRPGVVVGDKYVPAGLRDVVLPFNWDVHRVWQLPCPEEIRHRQTFDYLLELPLWSSQPGSGMHFDLSPMAVIREPEYAPHQTERILKTDTAYPLEFLEYRGQCWILDGVHRLAKLYISGVERVDIRIHEEAVIPLIQV